MNAVVSRILVAVHLVTAALAGAGLCPCHALRVLTGDLARAVAGNGAGEFHAGRSTQAPDDHEYGHNSPRRCPCEHGRECELIADAVTRTAVEIGSDRAHLVPANPVHRSAVTRAPDRSGAVPAPSARPPTDRLWFVHAFRC